MGAASVAIHRSWHHRVTRSIPTRALHTQWRPILTSHPRTSASLELVSMAQQQPNECGGGWLRCAVIFGLARRPTSMVGRIQRWENRGGAQARTLTTPSRSASMFEALAAHSSSQAAVEHG